MPNIKFVLGSLDLSAFVRVNPSDRLDPGSADMLEPAFSDSPFLEGQTLTSMHAKNKEMKWPLFLHPSQAPYLQDSLNQLVQGINQQLRPIVDKGQTVLTQWQNAQADFPTFFTVQFGRFEPEFNFRETEKGWLAGSLHLWTLPYGHTATQRVMGTWAAPAMQSGGVFPLQPGELSVVLAPSPVPNVYLRFNESMGPTGIDFMGNAYGSYIGGPSFSQPGAFPGDPNHSVAFATTVGGFSNALILPPLGSYVTPTQFTYGIWLNFSASSNQNQMLFVAATQSNFRMLFYINQASRSLNAQYGDGATFHQVTISTPTTMVPGTWAFAAYQYDGSYMTMFLNGTPIGSVAAPTPYLPATNSQLIIAAQNQLAQNQYVGLLDDGMIFATPIGSGAIATLWAAGPLGVVGDLSPQFEILTKVGSYLGDDGRLGIISALPQASYNPIIPVGSFIGLSPSAVIYGASGAWASQFLAMDNTGGSQGAAVQGTYPQTGYFSLALSPASIYAGDNRVLGLVRARSTPFGLRAFDSSGNALGPTVIASAMDGWQVIDYGILRVQPWAPTVTVNVQAYAGIPYNASGMFSPPRAAPPWTKEHGPIFVVPNSYSILDLDWNSPALTVDSFDGTASAALGLDILGNTWNYSGGGSPVYTGISGLKFPASSAQDLVMWNGPSGLLPFQSYEIEAVFTAQGSLAAGGGGFNSIFIGLTATNAPAVAFAAGLSIGTAPNLSAGGGGSVALNALLPGQYTIRQLYSNNKFTVTLAGPSGVFASFASGVVASVGGAPAGQVSLPSYAQWYPCFSVHGGLSQGASIVLESFRARTIASTGLQSRDILHLHQPNVTNTRANPSAVDVVDLQGRQRGPVQSINLPAPSLGAGLFVASFPWDQGPANDLLNVDVRVRERFTYAR